MKDKIKALCKQYKVYYHMPVQNGMGKPTLDFILCVGGHFVGIEAKAPGKKPTPRQKLTMMEMEAAGGHTMVVDGDKSLNVLEFFIKVTKANARVTTV